MKTEKYYERSDVTEEIIEVHWIDSSYATGWGHTYTVGNLGSHRSAGYRVKSDPDRVVLIQSKSNESMSEILEIPRIAVIKVRKLK